jgi:hypothetical protein
MRYNVSATALYPVQTVREDHHHRLLVLRTTTAIRTGPLRSRRGCVRSVPVRTSDCLEFIAARAGHQSIDTNHGLEPLPPAHALSILQKA